MTPRARTNQLLYQAELLLGTPCGEDEHAEARRMAAEEGALALTELALESLLREVTEHARLPAHPWRELLGPEGAEIAELHRLRELAAQPGSWLGWLITRLEALHSSEGAARRRSGAAAGLIAMGSAAALGEELHGCLQAAKAEVAALRETSQEW
ncbi:DUF6586 family protein [Halomonas mongoliensis]|uniref:DUF6586 family protein n=1 Tax=Halomonas mongoliensis TaxID=321265 RepID=UPI00403AABBC